MKIKKLFSMLFIFALVFSIINFASADSGGPGSGSGGPGSGSGGPAGVGDGGVGIGDGAVGPGVDGLYYFYYECSPGETQQQSCGLGGRQTRACNNYYQWSSWGSCAGEGVCSPGNVERDYAGCNFGGYRERVCQSNYQWGNYGACTNEKDPRLNIPDKVINEDSGFNDNLVDLHQYTTDLDTLLGQLTYTFISETNNNIVDCNLDSNRYIDCTTLPDKNGYSDITIEVSDGIYANIDTFRVNVNPVNDAPQVTITHPDEMHNNFVQFYDVNLMASATDIDSSLTYYIDWGNYENISGNVVNNVINIRHKYQTAGNYRITLTVSDGSSTDSDFVDIVVWAYEFDIINLKPYNNSDFTNEDNVFFRNEPLYIKFNVVQKDSRLLIANNINSVYLYNKDKPSNIYNLAEYNGLANGITISNGQPSAPDGSYYYYIPNLPVADDVLGWNIVFVFSHNGSQAGQKELEIQILNNPLQLAEFPAVNLNSVSGNEIYAELNLNDYASDVETPDNEISWGFAGMVNVIVDILTGNIARFSSALSWQGSETLTATANDNDGSISSRNIVVSSGNPIVNLISPNGGETIFGTTPIRWIATDYQNDTLTINLEYSDDNGAAWHLIVSGINNIGSYSWNTSSLMQGSQYLVRITATDSNGLSGYDISDRAFTILSSADAELSVKIRADKTTGEIPLEVNFDVEVISGNEPFSYAWDFNNDGAIDSTIKSPKAIFKEKGSYLVSLTVTDFDNDQATDKITINANEKITELPRKKIHINSIRFENEEIKPGEDLVVYLDLENQGNSNIKDSSVTIIVPDLAVRQKIGHIDLKTDKAVTKMFILETPEDTEPGFYDVMVVIYDNGLKRVKYRQIRII